MLQEYTLEQLAKLVRIHPRTIRSYIQQGLIRGPDSMGRNARYGEYHLKRLREIRTLMEDHTLTLKEIRHIITVEGSDQEIDLPMNSPHESDRESESMPESSPALDYIRHRRKRLRSSLSASSPSRETGSDVKRPLKNLLERLRRGEVSFKIPRKTRGEEWIRLRVTPEVEIHVRGPLPPQQHKDFQELADLVRHILLGGNDYE